VASFLTTSGAARLRRGALRAPFDALATRLAVGRADPAIRAILGEIGASAGGAYSDAARWTIHRARSTTSGGLVALVGPASGPILSIRTAPTDPGRHALGQEERALAELATIELPEAFRRLLPDVVATGSVGSVGYLAQRALPGRPVDPRGSSADARAELFAAAADAIRPLHDATSTIRAADPDDVERWVDRRVGIVLQLTSRDVRRDGSADARLAGLCSTLRDALLATSIPTSRIHGDLWTGNLLVTTEAGGRLAVSGIVDWDSSARREPPFQDLLHLELYTRKLVERASLGTVVARALGGHDAESRPAVAGGPSTLTSREVVLLYWLRQVEVNVVRNPAGAGERRWRQRNVDPVVACL
jgi:aminoglycoside phosphotransferase (APT) family kinase protein